VEATHCGAISHFMDCEKRIWTRLNNMISLEQCKIHHWSSVEMQISFSTYLSEVLCAQTQHALHWCQWPAQCNIYWWLVHEHWLFGRTTLQGVVGAASDMKILLENINDMLPSVRHHCLPVSFLSQGAFCYWIRSEWLLCLQHIRYCKYKLDNCIWVSKYDSMVAR